ncbi:GntR family transcriptional regulator [Sphingomonas piscis]|uniref:GntR family transcriptional regulator n=1 Tax=Sphingomonas piscis TaxID=2714943 RepID=A0A6G7YNI7_9SPHN|nr:GntR family transcriptional regulator [Sphingomonas piscis]QIK78301.1 GntR family transcriptional regulator [Sphingomonas piscis]
MDMTADRAQSDEGRVTSPVAQRIRELIVDGSLPAGARVAEAAIAERLGVSRTPVRNALPALAIQGLLEPRGRRGYAVRSFSVEQTYQATEMRCVLEGYAAHEIARKGVSREILAELRDALSDGDRIFKKGFIVKEDEERYARMNQRFHEAIVRGAENALLAELIGRVYAMPFVAPGVVAFNRIPADEIFPILMTAQHQHHAIVDAIEAGQPDVAEMTMRGHSAPARRSLGIDRAAKVPL